MRVLIVEDEPQAAEHLNRLLSRIDESITVVKCLQSVSETVNWMKRYPHPDLIFMDIQLSDGISFSIFEIVDVHSPIIFTTAYDKYAIEAFKVNSIDYLLKPIGQKDLARAISKWKKLSTESPALYTLNRIEIQSILKELRPVFKQRFLVKAGNHLKSIPVDEIFAFLSRDKATFLINKTGRQYPVDYSLSDLEDILDPELFFRVNRQDIISHQAIKDVISFSSNRLKIMSTISLAKEMIVSRDRVGDFRTWLDQ